MNTEICNLYKAKMSILDISKKVNVPRRKVRAILLSNNIEIKKSGLCNRKYIVYEDFFDFIDNEYKAYFLGFLFADGYNNVKDGFIRLTLHEKDKCILEKLNALIQIDRPLGIYTNKDRNTKYFMLSIRSRKLSNVLAEMGCVQKKTFFIKFPDETILSKNLRHHFIRGYFDGDGCITGSIPKNKLSTQYQFSLVSTEIFLKSIIGILKEELNITVNKLYTRHPERNNPIRSMLIGGNKNCRIIREWLYKDSTIYLDRKKIKFDLI